MAYGKFIFRAASDFSLKWLYTVDRAAGARQQDIKRLSQQNNCNSNNNSCQDDEKSDFFFAHFHYNTSCYEYLSQSED